MEMHRSCMRLVRATAVGLFCMVLLVFFRCNYRESIVENEFRTNSLIWNELQQRSSNSGFETAVPSIHFRIVCISTMKKYVYIAPVKHRFYWKVWYLVHFGRGTVSFCQLITALNVLISFKHFTNHIFIQSIYFPFPRTIHGNSKWRTMNNLFSFHFHGSDWTDDVH